MSTKMIDALKKGDEVQLIVKDKTRGKDSSRPVRFVLKDHELLLLPVKGSMSQWFKNILKNPQVTIKIAGQAFSGAAEPIRDAKGVSEVVELFKMKYGERDVDKYYSRLDAASKLKLKS